MRKLDQQFEVGSTDAIKSLVIAGLCVGFLSFWDTQQELGMGAGATYEHSRLPNSANVFLGFPSGELGGLPGEFYRFANSIRSELSAVSVQRWKEAA